MSERPSLHEEVNRRTGPKRRPSCHRRAKLSGWSSRWPHRPRCRGAPRRRKRGGRGKQGKGKKGGGARAVRSAKRTREYTTAYSSGGKPPKPRGREKAGDAREHKKKTSRHSTCEPKRGGRRQTPYTHQPTRRPTITQHTSITGEVVVIQPTINTRGEAAAKHPCIKKKVLHIASTRGEAAAIPFNQQEGHAHCKQ